MFPGPGGKGLVQEYWKLDEEWFGPFGARLS
jgi:hypothetical protein